MESLDTRLITKFNPHNAVLNHPLIWTLMRYYVASRWYIPLSFSLNCHNDAVLRHFSLVYCHHLAFQAHTIILSSIHVYSDNCLKMLPHLFMCIYLCKYFWDRNFFELSNSVSYSWSFSPQFPMSTLAQNSSDNRSTTGVIVAFLFAKKLFIILLKLQWVSLLFFFSARLLSPNRYAELHEDTGGPLRASTPLLARGVGRRRPGADGPFASEDSAYKVDQLDLLFCRTLRTDWNNWIITRNHRWKNFVFPKISFATKKANFCNRCQK